MQNVEIRIKGFPFDFDMVKKIAETLAMRDNEYATLVSWNDAEKGVHSPQGLQCEIKGEPGWEVYGRNHEGRLRISINEDSFVFIYS